MVAVAIGRFEKDVVGLRKEGRIADDRLAVLPQVPGEEEPALDAVFRTDDFRDRRAEDMPGVVEADRDTIVDRPVMPVGDGLEMGQRPLHVLAGEQRHNGVFPLSTLLAVPLPLVDGVFLLDPRSLRG